MSTRLNNFILWCKGWYESVNNEMDIFDEALIALKLDGYEICYEKPCTWDYIKSS